MSNNMAEPFGAFGFRVEFSTGSNGTYSGIGCFQDVSGLESTIAVEDYQEGGENRVTRKLAGHATFTNLKFKRGFCTGEIASLFNDYRRDPSYGLRIDGVITLLGDNEETVAKWTFRRGIPVRWSGPTLSVTQNSIAFEELEIAHEGFEVDVSPVSREF